MSLDTRLKTPQLAGLRRESSVDMGEDERLGGEGGRYEPGALGTTARRTLHYAAASSGVADVLLDMMNSIADTVATPRLAQPTGDGDLSAKLDRANLAKLGAARSHMAGTGSGRVQLHSYSSDDNDDDERSQHDTPEKHVPGESTPRTNTRVATSEVLGHVLNVVAELVAAQEATVPSPRIDVRRGAASLVPGLASPLSRSGHGQSTASLRSPRRSGLAEVSEVDGEETSATEQEAKAVRISDEMASAFALRVAYAVEVATASRPIADTNRDPSILHAATPLRGVALRWLLDAIQARYHSPTEPSIAGQEQEIAPAPLAIVQQRINTVIDAPKRHKLLDLAGLRLAALGMRASGPPVALSSLLPPLPLLLELDLSGNGMSVLSDTLGGCARLRRLVLRQNKLTDGAFRGENGFDLMQLPELQVLDLASNLLTGTYPMTP